MDSEFWTPLKVVVAALLAGLLLYWLGVGIWTGSWDLAIANAKRSYQVQKIQTNNDNRITQQGYANQTASVTRFDNDQTTIDQLESQIAGPNDPTLAADKVTARQTAQDACAAAQQMTKGTITSLGVFDGKWIDTNCQGGTLNPASKYFAS